jgi:hypothetical protein
VSPWRRKIYLGFAFTPVTYIAPLVGVLLPTTSSVFVAGGQNGLTSTLGQQHAMSGQISAVWDVFASIPAIVIQENKLWIANLYAHVFSEEHRGTIGAY